MRFFVFIFFAVLLVIVGEKALSLAIKGELFKPGAFKESFREIGKTLWLGMRLFVIVWILYLIVAWFMSKQN